MTLRTTSLLRGAGKSRPFTQTASQEVVEASVDPFNPTTPPPNSVRVLCDGVPALYHAESRTVFPVFK